MKKSTVNERPTLCFSVLHFALLILCLLACWRANKHFHFAKTNKMQQIRGEWRQQADWQSLGGFHCTLVPIGLLPVGLPCQMSIYFTRLTLPDHWLTA